MAICVAAMENANMANASAMSVTDKKTAAKEFCAGMIAMGMAFAMILNASALLAIKAVRVKYNNRAPTNAAATEGASWMNANARKVTLALIVGKRTKSCLSRSKPKGNVSATAVDRVNVG